MIQKLIAERLASQEAKSVAKYRPAHGVPDGKKLRRELRFTPTKLSILERAALRHGGSIRDYVISIARAHAADALVGKEERALLGQINYQLL